MASLQKFPVFLRESAVIRLDELPDPQPSLVKSLPAESALHFLGTEDNPSIDPSNTLMLGYSTAVRHMDVVRYPAGVMGGSQKAISVSELGASFDRKNRGFKYVKEIGDLKSIPISQLIVMNYGYLDKAYKYPETVSSGFIAFENKLKTMVATIKRIEEINPRNHFVSLEVPANLVPKSVLDKEYGRDAIKLANAFPGEDEQILRQIWLFINPNTVAQSVFGSLTDAEKKKVTLLFRSYDGKYTVVNLGYLFSWVRNNPNLTLMRSISVKGYEDVQRYTLRSMMVMQTINATGASEAAKQEALRQQAAATEAQEREEAEEGVSDKDDRFHQDRELQEAAIRDKSGYNEAGPVVGADGTRTPEQIQAQQARINNADKLDEPPSVNEEEVSADLDSLERIYAAQQLTKVARDKEAKLNAKATEVIPDADVAPPEGYTSDSPVSVEELKARFLTPKTTDEVLIGQLDKMAEEGRITATEYRKRLEMIKAAGAIPDPYGSGKTIAQAKVITKEELVITDAEAALNVPATVIDKSMARASLSVIANKYNTELINKDMLGAIYGLQKGGIVIKDYRIDRRSEITGDYEIHTLEIMPLQGMPSIITFRTPRILEDGTFIAKNTKYCMRAQFVDHPIRKIGPNRVGLSSYYGKTFVDRATRKAISSLEFVLTRLDKGTIRPDEHLRDVTPGDVFNNYFEAPYFYSGISSRFKSFKAGDATFDFNPEGFRKTLDPKFLEVLEKDGARICGWIAKGQKSIVIIDKNDNFWAVRQGERTPLGDIFDVLNLDRMNAPVDYAEVTVFSAHVPVGLFLARQMGFRGLVALLGAQHRLVEGRQQKNLQPHEYVVQFRDVAYIFDRRDVKSSLVLAGFQAFAKETRLYDAELFDSKDIYVRLVESKGINVMYMTEMDNLVDMFVDPHTERILTDLGEPITFNGLLLRSCELLQTYYYPASQDADYQRIRGYDRVPGFAYMEIVRAIRDFKRRNRTGRAKVDLKPFQVWATITRDSSVKQAEDINPIQSLKIAQEAVTYVGEGGRGKVSMNRQSRAYTESNLGVLSEASVDSSDVAINAFLAADPGFATVDGIAKKDRPMGAANLMSTSVLLAPFSENDDMKRRGFISIQQGHTIATEGYSAPMIRTGYESVIGMRTSETFAKVAKMDGVVTGITEKGITVKYKDGTEEGYALGTLYGKAEGSVYPHNLITPMKVGQKFKKDEYLSYNTGFFEPDPILPGGIVYKGSMMTRIAFMEVPQTHEDSSAISRTLSAKLTTTTTKVKTYTVSFKQNVLDIVKVGQRLKPEDILMVIEDEITSSDDSFRDASLSILSERSKNAPRSGYIGTVSDIEVFYHGDTRDMTSTLKSIATRSDKVKEAEGKARLKTSTTGFVNSDFTVDGVPLALGKAVIKVYINVSDDATTGDKVVWGHQLKSVIGEIMPYTLRTESGEEVHARIGAKSFAARIVESIVKIGELATILDATGKKAAKLFFG